MSYRILLIEDEVAMADSVACSLRNEGFEVEVALDGLAGLSAYRAVTHDLIILDATLPKLSGLDFCRIVRNESSVPIIMLTAKIEETDRIVGLEFGADDYVPKPFSMREVIARVRAVLRRIETARDDQHKTKLDIGPISMDVVRGRVTVDGKAVHLPLKQFELLRVLMTNRDKVVNREELFRAVWDAEATYDTGALDVHIRWLREKIEEDPSRPTLIRTVRGVGYEIVADAEQ
ncbi:MAG: hypothetical protein A2Z18_03740 [Armatimonadetes bacterium RBG_16_58_9]|nr:MAG: hypothetical protein A2Z18_03740 [Armatimonadetes bacterium RBG_16_58_9]